MGETTTGCQEQEVRLLRDTNNTRLRSRRESAEGTPRDYEKKKEKTKKNEENLLVQDVGQVVSVWNAMFGHETTTIMMIMR